VGLLAAGDVILERHLDGATAAWLRGWLTPHGSVRRSYWPAADVLALLGEVRP
jgi:hypothetical protein